MNGTEQIDYRQLADAIPDIVFVSFPDGAIEFYNRSWYDYTGLDADETLRFGWSNVLHADEIASITERWLSAMTNGLRYDNEFRLRRHDGTYRWFVGRADPVRDAAGNIVRWYGHCTDIHDLKLAEAAVREHAKTFEKLADALPQIIWIANAAGTNTYLNDRWYAYTGVDRTAAHSLAVVTHPDDFAAAVETWQLALATGDGFETEYRLRRYDGVYRWFLGRAIALRGPDGAISEWFGSCTDIDDQKRAEADLRSAYDRERRVATTLQRALLAHAMPVSEHFGFDAAYRPAEREAAVGGDWYDAIELDDGRIVLSIGDVAGHGLDAAVVMGNVRQGIRAVARVVALDPAAILDAADRSLRSEAPDTLVTAFVGIIDPKAHTLTYASAGHPPPLLASRGTIDELSGGGLPLGLGAFGARRATTIPLPNTGTIVLYTDGLTEATRDLAAGEERLREALALADESGAALPAHFIEQRVLRGGARDDVAVLTVSIRGRRLLPGAALHEQVA